VEAVHVRHGEDPAGRGGGRLDAGGALGVEGERLLAHHVLAGLERGDGQRFVEVVGRADVHDVDVGRDGQGVGCIGALGAQVVGRPPGGLGGGGGDGDQPGPRRPHGMGMDPTDEPGPGDAHSQLLPHAVDLTSALYGRQAEVARLSPLTERSPSC
jgi:hypothetical protein